MEELQLSLTPSRVDQRNQGLMLINWRVGQTVSALVSDRLPTGGLLLTVGGQSFVTSSDLPVQPGTKLMLEVQQTRPNVVLKFVEQVPARPSPHGSDIASRDALVSDGRLSSHGLSQLVGALSATKISRLEPHVFNPAQALASLSENFLRAGKLTPSAVQVALLLSGIFTEALWASDRTNLAARSTKTLLMTLSDRIRLALQAAGLTPEERNSLSRLIASVDTSLGFITKQQISSIPQDNSQLKWLTSLPLQLGDNVIEIDLEMYKRAPKQNGDQSSWQICLVFELEKLGPMRVNIGLTAQRVKIDFFTAEKAADHIKLSLPMLREQLITGGLQVENLSSILASTRRDPSQEATRTRLDVSV